MTAKVAREFSQRRLHRTDPRENHLSSEPVASLVALSASSRFDSRRTGIGAKFHAPHSAVRVHVAPEPSRHLVAVSIVPPFLTCRRQQPIGSRSPRYLPPALCQQPSQILIIESRSHSGTSTHCTLAPVCSETTIRN